MIFQRLPLPSLLLVLALALLPFGRMVEIPMGLLAIGGLMVFLRGVDRTSGTPWVALGALYVAFLLPMLLALPDAVAPGKSRITSLGTLRFGLSCCAMLWWYESVSRTPQARDRLLALVGFVSALLLSLWCLDGLLQFVTGRNVLGYGIGEGYINGVFGDDDNIKFGLTVALLLPIALVHGVRAWSPLLLWSFLLLVLTLILLSGKRAAWISALVEIAALLLYYFYRGRLRLRPVLLLILGAVLALGIAYSTSDWVRERSVVLVEAVAQRDYNALNRATGKRLPIWRTAVVMGRDNWVNGVGPRGFRYAYRDYAAGDDIWAGPAGDAGGSRASHAHQLLLELWAETGVFGIAGYLMIVAILIQLWRRGSAAARSRALPYGASLLGMLFPLNTHPAWYSSWFSLLLWLFVGLYLLALTERPGENATQ